MRIVEFSPSPEPTIHIFLRDEDGKRIRNDITTFRPYFYTAKHYKVPNDKAILEVDDKESIISLEGMELKKIILHSPKDVPRVRKYFDYTWEADIPFVDRYRLDYPEYKSSKPRTVFFDIETLSLNPESGEPIVSIAIYDSFTETYITLVWREDLKESVKDGIDEIVWYFNNERSMLQEFIHLIDTIDPDILSGWFSNTFDLPYLFYRLNANKIDPASLSPIHYTDVKNVRIKGRICLDLLRGYRKVSTGGRDSYKLGEIAQFELGYGKTENPGDIRNLWLNELDRLIEYNKNDVKLTVELDKKLSIISFFDMLCNEVNIAMNDGFFNSKIVDMYMLRTAIELGVKLPTKIRKENKEGKIKGAVVFQPIPGLHRDVAVFDLKSLYPSIIVSFNMSPETTIEKYKFKQDVVGIMPYALRHLFKQREDLKKQGSVHRQRVVKEIMNTFYGATLFAGFRLQNRDMGESITGTGRKILKWTKKIVEEQGFTVIGGDTDSVFVEDINEKQALKLLDIINESYNEFGKQHGIDNHVLKIELEEICETAFFIDARKRYALKTKEGMKVKGFEMRRSNIPRFGRDVQKNLLKMILDGKSKREIRRFLSDSRQKVRKLSLDEIALPASIRKPLEKYKVKTMPLRAMEWSNKNLKTEFGYGSKFLMVFVKSVPYKYSDTNLIAIDFGDSVPRGIQIDYDKHEEKCIDAMTKSISKGYDLYGKESNLDKFFGDLNND